MKRVIIIGATSGIGRALAERMAASGNIVGLTGRRESLLREIAARAPEKFRFVAADIARPEATEALERLVAALGGMDLCFVCAGTGDLNPELDFAREEPAIRTNVWGWTAVTDWAYGRFERQGRGHLVLVTSVGGLRGCAAAPAYAASKAYQINYAQSLRMKASGSGIVVTEIRPGLVDTAMAKGDGLFWVMPVARVAEQILCAVKRRKRIAVVTCRWRIVARLLLWMRCWE